MAPPPLLRGLQLLRLRLHLHQRLDGAVILTPHRSLCAAASAANSSTDLEWKLKEGDILGDIEPITSLTKDILKSSRYLDGERLTSEDETAVAEKLLAYHPHSEDKIGCGIDCIIVNRHPQYRHSRCMFVVRTNGEWIDFSYHKCLQAYIQAKYPSHADRFIKKHLKRRRI